MSSLNAIASSGLSAARMRLDASAGNVANMNTPGYRAQRVVQQAAPEGGVDASVQRANAEGVSLEQEVVPPNTRSWPMCGPCAPATRCSAHCSTCAPDPALQAGSNSAAAELTDCAWRRAARRSHAFS